MKSKVDIFTGIRPTGSLTVANYLGAVKPILELQKSGDHVMVFVADLHAMTDQEPNGVAENIEGVVADYLALGLDPKKVTIFVQSAIGYQIGLLTLMLMRMVTVAELTRLPTLKEKLKGEQRPENANALLAVYPVMMASDILLQKSLQVPVGDDQVPHLEITRLIAQRFNKRYDDVLVIPKVMQMKTVRISSLKGNGKMSKTSPNEAIFLTDTKEDIAKKIKSAVTAFAGEMNPTLESHIYLTRNLAKSKEDISLLDSIIEQHMSGVNVMKDFKELMTRVTQEFIADFQLKRNEIISNPEMIKNIIEGGNKIATQNADETLKEVMNSLYKK